MFPRRLKTKNLHIDRKAIAQYPSKALIEYDTKNDHNWWGRTYSGDRLSIRIVNGEFVVLNHMTTILGKHKNFRKAIAIAKQKHPLLVQIDWSSIKICPVCGKGLMEFAAYSLCTRHDYEITQCSNQACKIQRRHLI